MSEISESELTNLSLSVHYGNPTIEDQETLNVLLKHYRATQWIDVTERLPENHQRVLIFTGNAETPNVYPSQFIGGEWLCIPKGIFDLWKKSIVTHWIPQELPLPQPPRKTDE